MVDLTRATRSTVSPTRAPGGASRASTRTSAADAAAGDEPAVLGVGRRAAGPHVEAAQPGELGAVERALVPVAASLEHDHVGPGFAGGQGGGEGGGAAAAGDEPTATTEAGA